MVFNLKGNNIFLAILFILVGTNSIAETQDQQIKVALRTIGHEFLLSMGDSTSRILPIQKIEGRYVVEFENKFTFEPDQLIFEVFKYLENKNCPDSFIVEVEKCGTTEVIHSFEASLTLNQDLTACKGRLLPLDCYIFYFTILNREKALPLEQKPASSHLLIYPLFTLLFIGLAYFIFKKKIPKTNTDFLSIGQYLFDPKGMNLILKNNSTELSSKESELLLLFYSHESKTLERDHILNVVWGDEGNYVGRTLDVFVSKLRKKLEADPNIKIINVRGVGYRFVVG